MATFRVLPGLPPYGPLAVSFPPSWGRSGHEGLVVAFTGSDGTTWTGNFMPGIGGLHEVRPHPNGREVLAISGGDVWVVDPNTRQATTIGFAVDALWPVRDPEGIVFSLQGLTFMRIDRAGVMWETRRISWDGFRHVEVTDTVLTGEAWSLDDRWHPFAVELATGVVRGGSYHE